MSKDGTVVGDLSFMHDHSSEYQDDIHSDYLEGNIKSLESRLANPNHEDIDAEDTYGYSLLQKACFNGQINLAKRLIRQGADPFRKNEQGFNALILLAFANQEKSQEIFQFILNQRPNNKVKEENYIAEEEVKNLVLLSLKNKNYELANLVLEKSVHRNVIKKYLFEIADSNQLNGILKLNETKSIRYALLEQRIAEGRADDVRNILENKDFLSRDLLEKSNLITKFSDKIQEIKEEIIKLSEQGKKEEIDLCVAKINNIYKSMQHVIENNSFKEETHKILIQEYINLKELPEEINKEIKDTQKKFFDTLYNKNKEYLNSGTNGKTLLILSAKYSDEEIYNKLAPQHEGALSEEEKIKIAANSAASGSIELNNRFDFGVDTKNIITNQDTSSTLLMEACKGGNPRIIEKYIKHQLNPNQQDNLGNNALHYLAESKVNSSDYETNLQLLIDGDRISKVKDSDIKIEGADINARNKKGLTPLMLAVLSNKPELVRSLIEKGADVNIADDIGNTALIYACRLNNKNTIEALLTSNYLNVTHKNNQGISAYALSMRRDLEEFDERDDSSTKTEQAKDKKKFVAANTYKGLSQILLSRGADPYEKPAKELIDVAFITTLAVGAARLTEAAVHLTKHTPFAGVANIINLAMKATEYLAILNEFKELIKDKITSFMHLEVDKLSLEGKIMIGVVHQHRWRSLFSISHGSKLKKELDRRSEYKYHENAIYTVEDLKTKLGKIKDFDGSLIGIEKKDPDFYQNLQRSKLWAVTAQKDLQDQYQSIQYRLDGLNKGFPWPTKIWQRRELNTALENVKNASNELIKHKITGAKVNGETFEGKCFELINLIKDPQQSKRLLKSIVLDDKTDEVKSRTENIAEIIRSVANKEILVSPETYYEFCKFEQEIRKHSHSKETISKLWNDKSIEFLESRDPKDWSNPEYWSNPRIPQYDMSEIEEFKKNIKINNNALDINLDDEANNAIVALEKKLPPSSSLQEKVIKIFIKNSINSVVSSFGSEEKSKAENIAIGVNAIAITAASLLTVITLAQAGDPHANSIIQTACQSITAANSAITAANSTIDTGLKITGTALKTATAAVVGIATGYPVIGTATTCLCAGAVGYYSPETVKYIYEKGSKLISNVQTFLLNMLPKRSKPSIVDITPNIPNSTVDLPESKAIGLKISPSISKIDRPKLTPYFKVNDPEITRY